MTELRSDLSSGERVRTLAERIRGELGKRIFGLEAEMALLMGTVVAGRHVLMEGVPGLGKTLLLKTLAAALGCEFRRIQFTPDLLPADILGGYVYDSRNGSFNLRKGPIFANMILADEINRAPAKTRSALLEVMQERQVTIEGETFPMPSPFFVFATQNPLEHEGVYPLPQAQLDRFAMRLLLQYPGPAAEEQILSACREPAPEISAVADPAQVLAVQRLAERVTVSDEIIRLIARVVRVTRDHDGIAHGASPRVGVDLVFLARAALSGRDRVIPDDVKALFPHVTNHRMILILPTIAELTDDAVVWPKSLGQYPTREETHRDVETLYTAERFRAFVRTLRAAGIATHALEDDRELEEVVARVLMSEVIWQSSEAVKQWSGEMRCG